MVLITEFEQRSDEMHIRFRNLGKIIFPDWHHQFVSKSLGTEREIRPDKVEEIKKKIQKNGLGKYKQILKKNYHHAYHIYMPIKEKKKLPYHYYGGKKIDDFIFSHYTDQGHMSLRSPGTEMEFPPVLEEILFDKIIIEDEIESLRNNIAVNAKTKSTSTRRFNQLVRKEKGDFLDQKRNIDTLIAELGEKVSVETEGIVSLVNNDFSLRLEHSQESYLQEYIKKARNPSAEEIMNSKWLFFDIEIPNFRNDKTEISWVGATFMHNGKKTNEIHTLHDIGEEYKGYKIYKYNNEAELIEGFGKRVNEENPYIVSAYNAKFDLIKMREGAFNIGADKSKPIHRSTAKFFERIGIRDRFVIDFMHAYSKKAKRHNPNAKLDMNSDIEKSLNYDEMEYLENNGGHFEIADYLIGDNESLPNLHAKFMKSFKLVMKISDIYNVGWERILHSANSINVDKERQYFLDNGIYRSAVFPFCTTHRRDKETEGLQHFLNTFNTIKGKKGVFKNVMKVHIPVGKVLQKFNHHEKDKKLYEMLDQTNDPEEKFFIDHYLKATNRWLLQDYGYLQKLIKQFKKEVKVQDWREFSKNYTNIFLSFSIGHDFIKECLVTRIKTASIEELHEHMSKPVQLYIGRKEITDKKFHSLIKKYFAIELQKKLMYINYGITASRFFSESKPNDDVLRDHLLFDMEAKEQWLRDNNIEVYASEGEYLYLPANEVLYDSPFTVVDTIDSICSSDKVYYKKNGYYNHLRIKDNPSRNLNIVQMRTYAKMIDAILDGNEELARSILDEGAKECRTCDVKDLWYHIKTNDEYKLHTDKGFIQINPERPKGEKIIEGSSYSEKDFTLDHENIKIPDDRTHFMRKEKKIYIGAIDSFNLNRKEAEKAVRKKGKEMIDIVYKEQLAFNQSNSYSE